MRRMPLVAGMLGLAAVAGTVYMVRRRRQKKTLRGRLDDATSEATDRANEFRDTAQSAVSNARETAEDALHTAQERVVHLKDRAQEKLDEVRKNARKAAS